MSIKSFALIAATIAATGTAATADSYFGFNRTLDTDTAFELGLVRAEGNGTIEVYDYSRGEQGTLLGTQMVNAGANTDVRVNVRPNNADDVIALLKIDGQVVAEQRYEIND